MATISEQEQVNLVGQGDYDWCPGCLGDGKVWYSVGGAGSTIILACEECDGAGVVVKDKEELQNAEH